MKNILTHCRHIVSPSLVANENPTVHTVQTVADEQVIQFFEHLTHFPVKNDKPGGQLMQAVAEEEQVTQGF